MPTQQQIPNGVVKKMESANTPEESPRAAPEQSSPPKHEKKKRAASGAGLYTFFRDVNGRRTFEKGKSYSLDANPFPASPHICKKVD